MGIRRSGKIGTIWLLLAIPMLGRADVVLFSDYGSGNTYNTGFGWTIGGGGSSLSEPAAAFTPSLTAGLTQINISLAYISGTNQVDVNLKVDAGGAPAVNPLESWVVTGLPPFSAPGQVETLTSSSPIKLHKGTTYWLQVLPGDATTNAIWYENDFSTSSSIGALFVSTSGTPSYMGNQYLPAFGVSGGANPVPEPGFVIPIGAAFVGLLMIRKRHAA